MTDFRIVSQSKNQFCSSQMKWKLHRVKIFLKFPEIVWCRRLAYWKNRILSRIKVAFGCLVLLVFHSSRRGTTFSMENANIIRGLREPGQTEEGETDVIFKRLYTWIRQVMATSKTDRNTTPAHMKDVIHVSINSEMFFKTPFLCPGLWCQFRLQPCVSDIWIHGSAPSFTDLSDPGLVNEWFRLVYYYDLFKENSLPLVLAWINLAIFLY